MVALIIQYAIISFIFILIVHNIIFYFISLLTNPKDKEDFQIFYETPIKETINIGETLSISQEDGTSIANLPIIEATSNNMKEELKLFLQSQLDSTSNISLSNIPLPSN